VSAISTIKDVRSEIARAGYSLLRSADLLISDELRQEWLSLSIDYADLPADEHSGDGARHRFRRSGRFRYSPSARELTRLPIEDCVECGDINRVTGGIVRKFAPLLDTTFDNPFLRELIRFDFEQFPLDSTQLRRDWEVQAHLIRVTADSSEQGHPSPEGIHRDGAAFVTVHLAELVNAEGGDVSIYDDRQLLTSFRLDMVMDSYFFNDAILWHAAEPIVPQSLAHGAIRSILTFDYHPGVAGSRAAGKSDD